MARWMFLMLLGVFLAPFAFAGEADEKRKHLRYKSSYEEAMLEARIRNLPIFFSRHKDF